MQKDAPITEADEDAHLYEQLTAEIARLIDTGTLRAGERVPSG